MSSHFHSASQNCRSLLSANCTYNLRLFRLFYGDSSGMYKFPSATCMVFIQWWCERGDKSHVSKEISGRGRRRSRGEKGNQGVGDFRFINILQFFLFIIFIILSFFPYFFFTHDQRPLPTTHDPRHLATLVKTGLSVEGYVIAWLNCGFAKIFCASH